MPTIPRIERVNILTLNCGSSSVKYQLYDWERRMVLARGAVERVAASGSLITHSARSGETTDETVIERDCPTHVDAISLIIETLVHPVHGAVADMREVNAVGHRVVHGGDRLKMSIRIDSAAIELFRSCIPLAPLHLPANIAGIEAALDVLPGVPQCAIMDTAWHQTMPEAAYIYAVPYEWHTDLGVRKFGFHGTSFLYCAKRSAVLLGKDALETNLIICHIGNGASVCAVRDGVSVDTSMGLTPLEGLVMGTRCGDIDPAIAFYLMRETEMSVDEIDSALNKKSGLIGITGEFVDRRDIASAAKAGNTRAQLAIDIESYRLRKYIGAYAAVVGRVDALVFTAGVGETQATIRAKATEGLENFGISIDPEKNAISTSRNVETDISARDSKSRVFVIPTDEELVMTEDTHALLAGTYNVHTEFCYSFHDKDYVNNDRESRFSEEVPKNPGLFSIRALQPR